MEFSYPNKPKRIYNVEPWAITVDMNSWIVQPKWNGHRALPHCDELGKIKVYSRHGNGKLLTLAKSDWLWLSMLDLPRPWALDAELLRDGRMIAWDFSLLDGKLRINEPYIERLTQLQSLTKKVSKDKFSFECIETLPATKYKNFMMRRSEPELEGFVFKNPQATDLWNGQYPTTENPSQIKYRF